MNTRIGVIGLGIGERHLQEYSRLEGVRLSAVAEPRPERAERARSLYGVRTYSDGLEMIEQEPLDAVSICTPPASHRILAQAAAAKGLHVLLEKPMAPSVADCDAISEACRRAGVVLLLGFKKRSSPPFRFLKQQERRWGRPRVLHVRYQLGPVDKDWFWDEKDGGGPFIENTAHAFDMLRFLLGDAERVYAEGGRFFAAGRDLTSEAVATIRFRNGSIVSLAAGSGGIWGYDQSERWVLNYDLLNAELSGPFDSPRLLRMMRRDAATTEERWWAETSGWPEQMQHFLACVRGQEEPRATAEDGRAALELGLALKQSIREGRPVDLQTR
ncbi:MAG: Gfo/Idh/MocA family oxidoreductase [Anaerolineae bacterium]|nr:Gfo/Idh/MocA family oxidoreductase [Anaerolineae bacterium]